MDYLAEVLADQAQVYTQVSIFCMALRTRLTAIRLMSGQRWSII